VSQYCGIYISVSNIGEKDKDQKCILFPQAMPESAPSPTPPKSTIPPATILVAANEGENSPENTQPMTVTHNITINNQIGGPSNGGPSNLNFQKEYERRFLSEGAVPLIDMESQYSTMILWISWLFGGLFGIHRFILGHWALGFLYMFTMGLLAMGWIGDGFALTQLIKEGKENQRMDENKS